MDANFRKKKTESNRRIEEGLDSLYKEEVWVGSQFKQNLDKIVDNAIEAEIALKAKKAHIRTTVPKKSSGFFERVFKGAKWQAILLSSFMGFLLVGTITLAAVPTLRDAVKEAIVSNRGTLYINSEPQGAEVQLKGPNDSSYKSYGITPLQKKLPKGEYSYKLTKDGYNFYEGSFTIENDEKTDVNVVLIKEEEWVVYSNNKFGIRVKYPYGMDVNAEEDIVNYSLKITFSDVDFQLGVEINQDDYPLYEKIGQDKGVIGDRVVEITNFRMLDENGKLLGYLYRAVSNLEANGNSIGVSIQTKEAITHDLFIFFKEFMSKIEFFTPVFDFSFDTWETCENKDLGLSIKYPAEWSCKTNYQPESVENNIVLENTEGQVIELTQPYNSSSGEGQCSLEKITDINLNGKSFQIDFCYKSDLISIFKQIQYGESPDDMFYLIGRDYPLLNLEMKEKLKLIFGSIQLLEEKDPYEGWNTYTNSKYGYSLRYPSDWSVTEVEKTLCPQNGSGCDEVKEKGDKVLISNPDKTSQIIIKETTLSNSPIGSICTVFNTINEIYIDSQKLFFATGNQDGFLTVLSDYESNNINSQETTCFQDIWEYKGNKIKIYADPYIGVAQNENGTVRLILESLLVEEINTLGVTTPKNSVN